MKKRMLLLLLSAAMLLSLFTVGASAATEMVDGVGYVTVSTAKEFSDAMKTGGNILLKKDIALDLSYSDTILVKPGTVLNGNGYSLTYPANRTEPLFCYETATAIGQTATYIKNISFGTKEAPMKLSGEVSLFKEQSNDTTYVIYQNVDFYVQGTSLTGYRVGALYSNLVGVVSFYGCTLNAELSSSTSGNLLGAWVGENNGDLVMTDCTTIGTVKGNGTCTAAFLGQGGSNANSRFTNCINLANVTGAELTAGVVGNVGTGSKSMYFTNCKNYGNITSLGKAYSGAAGGIIARSSNIQDQSNQRLRVFYDCINYGTITAGTRAGGILGTSHDWDTGGKDSCYSYYTFENCINYGVVSGGEYAGGIMGIASPATLRAEITDCINVGKITATKGYAGNFAGMLCGGVITGGYAAGVISTKMGSDVLVPCVSGSYTMQEGRFQGEKWSVKAPTASEVTYVGTAETVGKGITKVTGEALTAALLEMSALGGVSFIAADADDANSYVVAAEPILRGVQQSVSVTDGKVDLRFAAGVNALKAYKEFGFRTVVYEDGKKTENTQTSKTVYTSLNTVLSGGKTSALSASDIASKYICTGTVTGIALAKDTVIEVTPYAVAKDGTKYEGTTRVISAWDGVYQIEPMLLNEVPLEDYVIVYASSDKLSEKLLATRMSDEIAKLTGISIPVIADNKSTAKTAKILIGQAKQVTAAATGRTLRTQEDSDVIVISGTNTAQLSESIGYFLDTVEAKMLEGNNSWKFTSVEVPVDEEITLMAYNMGAKDKAAIKEAEWNLIVDYLPDIWTSQEPWAGFLDDFLNDYAVKPATKFEEDPKDDDVMKSDVNNKCFTGSGYYGVYWGLPRWEPGDKNTSGKASYSVILYAKDRFTPDLTRSGTFWLSETVDQSSVYPGSSFPRCATYLTLTDNNTGKTFTVVNVHLDFVANVQLAQIEILLQELKTRVGEDMPIFVTGDMNSEAHSAPIALYKDNDVMPMTAMDEIAERAYRDRRNIDWFFTNHPEQVEVSYYNYCGEHTYLNNQWNSEMVMGMPSDHPAIYTKFKLR